MLCSPKVIRMSPVMRLWNRQMLVFCENAELDGAHGLRQGYWNNENAVIGRSVGAHVAGDWYRQSIYTCEGAVRLAVKTHISTECYNSLVIALFHYGVPVVTRSAAVQSLNEGRIDDFWDALITLPSRPSAFNRFFRYQHEYFSALRTMRA